MTLNNDELGSDDEEIWGLLAGSADAAENEDKEILGLTAGSTDAAESEDEEIWGMLAGSADAAGSEDEEVWGMLAGSADAAESEGQEADPHEAEPRPSSSSTAESQPLPEPELEQRVVAEASACCQGASTSCCGGGGGPNAAPLATEPVPHGGSCCRGGAPNSAPLATEPLQRPKGRRRGGIPEEILQDVELNELIASRLPANYEFEVHRTVWRLQRCSARHIGLQMPEGLQAWATVLADIFKRFVPSVEAATILGDVSFGACCIDDLASRALGCDYLVHYGHSCIVPVDQTTLTMLYVHVEVKIDVDHLVETVCLNFKADQNIVFMGTVQFTSGINQAVDVLKKEFLTDSNSGQVPQVKPLGVGETLGCTSPHVPEDTEAVIFVCDGRFHLESAMIQNPHVKQGFFRYDPFNRTLSKEGFAYAEMHRQRRAAIEAARGANFVGLILGTLGRQGSTGILEELEGLMVKSGVAHFTMLLSEVSPERLALFNTVDAWVQVACPRLSLDWGDAFEKPLLTPYEAHIAWGSYSYKDVYPMDYYSNKGGPWSNYGPKDGYGGSLGKKFRHLGQQKKHRLVEYDTDCGF